MATIPGTILASKISPGDTQATFPTHIDFYGQGGLMCVPSYNDIFTIPIDRQKVGMLIYSQDNNTYYTLSSLKDPTITSNDIILASQILVSQYLSSTDISLQNTRINGVLQINNKYDPSTILHPVTGNALITYGGNIRVEGIDLSMLPLSTLSAAGTDGQSLFDLRSASPSANYNLSIASSGIQHFIKLFGGREGDAQPFIVVKTGEPLRFASFSNFFNTEADFTEYMRVDTGTGNVGIGTQTPLARLTVSGTISGHNLTTSFGAGSATGDYSFAEGYATTASGSNSHAEGASSNATGATSHAEGNNTTASGNYSHSEGDKTTASGESSHAEGYYTIASGEASHASGHSTVASGDQSFTIGIGTSATTSQSFAGGTYSVVKDRDFGFSFGRYNVVTHDTAVALGGNNNLASGPRSHAHGNETIASGYESLTEGTRTGTGNRVPFESYNATTKTFTFSPENSAIFFGEHHGNLQITLKGCITGNNSFHDGTFFYVQVQPDSLAARTPFNTLSALRVYYEDGSYGVDITSDIGSGKGWLQNGSGWESHAEGYESVASGFRSSHAEGVRTLASGNTASHAEGYQTIASGTFGSHAEGRNTTASGSTSHAEGSTTTASGSASHAEGLTTTASGVASHAEGHQTQAFGDKSHAEGNSTIASGVASHAEGSDTTASGEAGHAEGYYTTASGYASHSEGNDTTASGLASHAEGLNSEASGNTSHAEGNGTIASGSYSHAEGSGTQANAIDSHSEGSSTVVGIPNKTGGHAEGDSTTVLGSYAHAEGLRTTVGQIIPFLSFDGTTQVMTFSPEVSAATQGFTPLSRTRFVVSGSATLITIVSRSSADGSLSATDMPFPPGVVVGPGTIYGPGGDYAHAEGRDSEASGVASHAEGYGTKASGDYSHAAGSFTIASGLNSRAEGISTIALGDFSHASGATTKAFGLVSHAAGSKATAAHDYSYAWGSDSTLTNNVSTTRTSQYMVSAPGGMFIPGNVGIGTDSIDNALTINGTLSTNNTIYTNDKQVVTTNTTTVPGTSAVTNILAVSAIPVTQEPGTLYILVA